MMTGDDVAVVSRRNYIGDQSSFVIERRDINCEVRRSMGGIVKVDLGICGEIDRYTCMCVLEANEARGEG